MITKEQFRQKYERIHEHFSLRDCFGLAALIFGLFFSNGSLTVGSDSRSEKSPASTQERSIKKQESKNREKPTAGASEKRKESSEAKKQRVAASRKSY